MSSFKVLITDYSYFNYLANHTRFKGKAAKEQKEVRTHDRLFNLQAAQSLCS